MSKHTKYIDILIKRNIIKPEHREELERMFVHVEMSVLEDVLEGAKDKRYPLDYLNGWLVSVQDTYKEMGGKD